MADGVDITAGTGTKVLTDDTGAGGHAQVVKLAISTDGSATLVPADASNGIDVDVTRVSGTVTVTDSAVATALATLISNTDQLEGYSDTLESLLGALTSGTQQVIYTPPAGATLANVSGSASSVTLQAANTGRRGWSIHNDSTAILYVKFGSTASATSYTVKLIADAYYEMPAPYYRGIITGIWASATGAARVTEVA